MKNIFPEQFPITSEEAQDLWNKAIFAIDTNILVHLYRYSDAAIKELFEALEAYKSRLWVPNWVAKEFINQRLDRISEHIRAYTKVDAELDEIVKSIQSDRHPFLPTDLQKEFEEVLERVRAELISTSKSHEKKLTADEIFERIHELVGDNIGPEYNQEALDAIAAEGVVRYENRIPPGFKDQSKNDPNNPLEKYGDLIIWKQLIDKANESGSSIIFICDDKKEDWILEKHGNKIGPLPALRKEFTEATKQQFHLYNAERFVHYHNTTIGKPVKEEIQAEFRKVQQESFDIEVLLQRPLPNLFSGTDLLSPHFYVVHETAGFYWKFRGFNETDYFVSNKYFPNVDVCYLDINHIRELSINPFSLIFSQEHENALWTLIWRDPDGQNACQSLLRNKDQNALTPEKNVVHSYILNAPILHEWSRPKS